MMGILVDGHSEYSARIRGISRGAGLPARLLLLAAGLAAAAPAQPPVVTFFVLPDGLPGPGSESVLAGVGPQGGTLALDFVAGQERNEEGYVTMERDPLMLSRFHVRDLRLTARDAATGLELSLAADPSGGGTWTTSASNGAFGPGATINATIAVSITATGPGAAGWPAQGTLTLSGILVPGYYHQVVLLQGSVDVLPQATVSLFMKQDLHPPGVVWVTVATGQSAALVPGAGLQGLRGEVSLRRDPLDFRDYVFEGVQLTGGGGAGPVITGSASGSLHLDPASRSVGGTLSVQVDGVAVVRVLDGIGETFTGPVSRPSGLRLDEPALGGLGPVVIDLRRVELVPAAGPPVLGTTYDLVFRAPPGELHFMAAAWDPVPGISTPVGDVFVDQDPLLAFSLDPANTVFLGGVGVAPASGEAAPSILLPALPQLAGTSLFVAGAVIGTAASAPGVRAVTNSHRIEL